MTKKTLTAEQAGESVLAHATTNRSSLIEMYQKASGNHVESIDPDGNLTIDDDPLEENDESTVLCMVQSAIAKARGEGQHLGVTVQQIQKYERGVNRISVPMLYAIAEALAVSVYDILQEPETAEAEKIDVKLVALIGQLPGDQKQAVLDLVRALGKEGK